MDIISLASLNDAQRYKIRTVFRGRGHILFVHNGEILAVDTMNYDDNVVSINGNHEVEWVVDAGLARSVRILWQERT